MSHKYSIFFHRCLSIKVQKEKWDKDKYTIFEITTPKNEHTSSVFFLPSMLFSSCQIRLFWFSSDFSYGSFDSPNAIFSLHLIILIIILPMRRSKSCKHNPEPISFSYLSSLDRTRNCSGNFFKPRRPLEEDCENGNMPCTSLWVLVSQGNGVPPMKWTGGDGG